MIDYARARQEHPKHKAALTRARRTNDPLTILAAVERAYDAFDTWGAWPDDWATWRVAALDAYHALVWYDRELSEDDRERFEVVLAR